MAWYVIVRKEDRKSEKENRLFYVVKRTSNKKGYEYKLSSAIKQAKVFLSEALAKEWQEDLVLEDNTAEVMDELGQQKYSESRKSREGKTRKPYKPRESKTVMPEVVKQRIIERKARREEQRLF